MERIMVLKRKHLISSVLIFGSTQLFSADPTFFLKNKSTGEILVDIRQGQKVLLTSASVQKKSDIKLTTLNPAKETTLDIYFCSATGGCKKATTTITPAATT